MKIGLVRGLYTYYHFPQWRIFFEQLGFDVVLSDKTDKDIVARGVQIAPAELCLPVKVFLGQIDRLLDRVDFVFLPRMVCRFLENDWFFGCPKAIALPDLVRAIFPEVDKFFELIIDQRIQSDEMAFVDCARQLGGNSRLARRVFKMVTRGCIQAAENQVGSFTTDKPEGSGNRLIGVIGHPYLIYDEHISLNILKTLGELGVVPVVPEVTEQEMIEEVRSDRLPNWFYELELFVKARKLLRAYRPAGILLVSSFACGTASVVNELIRRRLAARGGVPILTLLLDEHSSEIGLRTRLESFVDLISAGEIKR